MKKIFILLFCWMSISLISCYEDKGNYDYTKREDIVVKGFKSKYTVVSLSDTLDILPAPESGEACDYLWLLYNIRSSFSFDTIGFEQHLQWPVTKPQGEYKLMLKTTAKSDGYSRMFESAVSIVSTFSDGWFVLKDQNQQTDIDFFPSDSVRMANILEQSIGRNISGEARSLTLLPGFTYLQPDGEIAWGEHMFWVSSAEDAWLVRIKDMSLQRDFSEMFWDGIPQEKPRFCVTNGGYHMELYTDRNVYYANVQGPGTGQFGLALDFGKEMEIGKHALLNGAGSYFYNQKSQSFHGVRYQGGAVTFAEEGLNGRIPPVKVNHTGCSMLYMGINKEDAENFYAVMENASEQRYVFTLLSPGTNDMGTFNPILTVDTLKMEYKINEASLFAIGSTLPYIYHNDRSGSTIHFYDTQSRKEVKEVFTFPGEKITFFKALYYDPWQEENMNDKFDKFVIATECEGHYKVYLYDLLAGKPYPGREPQVLEGDGTVRGVQRIVPSLSNWGVTKCSCNY